jgi:hypothetical protein
MQRITAFRLVFLLAALLFVAKPFFGFGVLGQQPRPHQQHTILAKSFTKRKPESLEEADANAEIIHQQLINPFATILSGISFLLLILFPVAFKSSHNITGKIIADIRYALLPTEHTYLLTGKLII